MRLISSTDIKAHFFNSHLNKFAPNLGDVNEEHGERFHQDFKVMEEGHQTVTIYICLQILLGFSKRSPDMKYSDVYANENVFHEFVK